MGAKRFNPIRANFLRKAAHSCLLFCALWMATAPGFAALEEELSLFREGQYQDVITRL